jgi:hypothetical protein
MTAASGTATVDTTQLRGLGAKPPVELRNIRGQGVVGQHMIIPVRLDDGGASINVQGSAEVTLNGVSYRVAHAWWRNLLPSVDPVTFTLALVTAFLAAAALRVGAQKTKRRRRRRAPGA